MSVEFRVQITSRYGAINQPFINFNITLLREYSPLPPNATTCSYELSCFPSWLWR